MISPITVSKFYSTLGNNNSLWPMALKDTSNSLGLTVGSYITGQGAESQDRFIDEIGTQGIWLLGLPLYKMGLNWGLFKPLGLDPEVDVRVLKDPEVFEKAKKFAKITDAKYKDNNKVKKISKSLEDITNKQKLFKSLTFGKFVAATVLTILSYGALTDFRQKYRKDKITKEFYEKEAQKNKDTFVKASTQAKTQQTSKTESVQNNKDTDANNAKTTTNANGNKNTNGKPNFTGLHNIQDFMFSPVKNLMIVDGAITTERLAKAQNKQELMGYAIKEGSFWVFMYLAGAKIKSMLENHSLKKHNIPIDLDARVIESEELKNALLNNKIMHNVNQFPVGNPSGAEIYEFVNTNPDNLIVKMAKQCDIIPTLKNTEPTKEKNVMLRAIDNRKFIDPEEVKGMKDKLTLLYNKGQEFIQKEITAAKEKAKASGEEFKEFTPEDKLKALSKYLDKVKKGNRGATLKNIGACIGFLGVLMPAMIVGWRFMDKENKDYQVRTEIENQLKAEMEKNKTQQAK